MVDWENIRERCMNDERFIRLEKTQDIVLPNDFHESTLGLAKGAIRQFRDTRETNSLHVHEFSDHYLAHVDTFNPEYHPVAHGVIDTPGMTLGIVLGAFGLYMLAKTAKNLTTTFDEEYTMQ